MFDKVLVANRGEIAIRALRAGYELGARTVAVFPYEDRNSLHRFKADEAYQIGIPGHPVRAYLSVEEIVATAVRSGADAVYPGYGFLSENPGLAAACAAAGITFIGPPTEVLELTGNKATAVAAAKAAGLPVLSSSEPSADIEQLLAAAADMRFPVFVKAVAGGGGRGMRRVETIDELADAIAAASREADTAFGDPTVFLEQAVVNPRHIEVQILADTHGNVIHLYERDCSMQRRHQKVVELAPAPNLDPEIRDRICADAVAFARQIGYSCAGTVEFLLDEQGRHVFIEMNPRIQVEHTVTEEITDVDLVQSQLRVAAGATLAELGLTQESIVIRGAALQCRNPFIGQLRAAIDQARLFGAVFHRLARNRVVVRFVWLAQVGGVGVGHGALLAHPQQRGAGIQAARKGDADLLASGEGLEDGVGHGLAAGGTASIKGEGEQGSRLLSDLSGRSRRAPCGQGCF